MRWLPWDWWKLSFLWFLQLKSRSPQAKQGLFRTSFRVAVLSLAIGIGALSVTLALVSGFEWTLGTAVQNTSGHVTHSVRRWYEYPKFEQFVAAAPAGVRRAEFFWSSQGLIVGKIGGRGVLIEGRRAAGSTGVDRPLEQVQVTLGKPLAQYLGVAVGDTVRLLLPGIIKASLEARVTQLVTHGIYEMDSRLVVVDDESLRNYLRTREPEAFASRPGDAHGLRLFLDPNEFTPKNIPHLEGWVEKYREAVLKIEPDESVHRLVHWRDAKSGLFRGIEYSKRELSLIIGLLTLVAALNIAATLVVLFLERDREIAVLQALGMGPFEIVQWVAIQGVLLGLASSILGLGLGRLLGWLLVRAPFAKIPEDIYNISQLPLRFDFGEQSAVFAFGVLAAVIAAIVLGIRLGRVHLISLLGTRR